MHHFHLDFKIFWATFWIPSDYPVCPIFSLGHASPKKSLVAVVNCLCDEGGFTEFKAKYPTLCTSSEMRCVADQKNHPHHSSLSQPCLPVSNVGPTRILPFLFLGSQLDSMSRETMLVRCIDLVHSAVLAGRLVPGGGLVAPGGILQGGVFKRRSVGRYFRNLAFAYVIVTACDQMSKCKSGACRYVI